MASIVSQDSLNQTISNGIAVSAATAIQRAQQFHLPLVVWVDGKVTEISPAEFVSTPPIQKPQP